MFDLNKIIRPHIKLLEPYSSARSEFNGTADIMLDANENPYPSAYNRYPDSSHTQLKLAVSDLKHVSCENIFVGNGSDEAIDLLFRAFCNINMDKAYIFAPSYGMYQVSAAINDIEHVAIPLTSTFELPSIEVIEDKIDSCGLLFICSPNNPTGNIFPLDEIKKIAKIFNGLVVLDEAYIDFSNGTSGIELLDELPNLVVLQTLSKAHGLAGLRVGFAFAHKDVISVLNKIKPPYNVNAISQEKAIEALTNRKIFQEQVTEICKERDKLINELNELSCTIKVFPSQANFVLAIFSDSQAIFQGLKNKSIIIRDRSQQINNTLRISIGTPKENTRLIHVLKELCP